MGEGAPLLPREPSESIFEVWQSIFEVWQSIFEIRQSIFEIRQSIFEVWQSIFEIRQSIFEVWQSIFEVWQSIFEAQFIPASYAEKGQGWLVFQRSIGPRTQESTWLEAPPIAPSPVRSRRH